MPIGVAVAALDGNRVLGPLPQGERTRLAALMTPYRSDHEILVRAGGTIEQAWFPTSGLISVVAALRDGKRAEIATVGREGMAGLPLFLGSRASLYEIVAQVSGDGVRLGAEDFLREVERSSALRTRMLKYSEARLAMTGQTAACNAAHPIRARLARWLLISRDSVDGDRFELTHEFLSTMLGAERPSVTVAAGALQRSGAITYRRGAVHVLDRSKLERTACECYGIVRGEVDRLMDGRSRRPPPAAVRDRSGRQSTVR